MRRPGLASTVRVVVLLVLAVYWGLPLLWLVLAPSKTNYQLVTSPPISFGAVGQLIDTTRHLFGYNHGEVAQWLANTAFYTVFTLLIAVTCSLLAGYAFALFKFRGRRLFLFLTLVAMVLPDTAMILPVFLEVRTVGLINTALSVILPSAFFPFGVYLAYVYYATSMSREVFDAARVDGCTEVQLFLRIALPLSLPLVGLVGFFSFVGTWNSYFLPYVMLADDAKYNLPVGIGALASGAGVFRAGPVLTDILRPEIALAALVTVLPILVIFLVSQRALVRGTLAGATKG
jgi:multiple sugar transport system permease protein